MKPFLLIRFFSFFIGFTCSFCLCFSQKIDFENYTTLSSSGQLPDEFSSSSSQKYYADKKDINRKDNKSKKRALKEFYLNSAFAIDELLKGGRVIYNDPVGVYINEVAEYLFEFADLKIKPRVFIIKSNYANAFATDKGQILVTTGLIARLENEAQLAFILCHEMIHFKKKHSIDIFLNDKLENKEKYIKNGAFESEPYFLSKATYSKEKELEADALGLAIFNKTAYNRKHVTSCFEILKKISEPFVEVPFSISFFETNNLKWSKNHFKKVVELVEYDNEYDDSYSTHPNIFTRKKALSSTLSAGEKDFVISKERFNTAKKASQFEHCRIALLNAEYYDALYTAYGLLKKHPNNKYLNTVIAKALYSVSYHKSRTSSPLENINASNYKGNQQALYHFFQTLNVKEASVLSTDYIWRLSNTHNSKELNRLRDLSFISLYNFSQGGLSAFSKTPITDSAKLANEIFRETPLSYAFADYFKDSSFKTCYENAIQANKTKSVSNNEEISISNRQLKKKKGEKVIFLSPLYIRIDARKEVATRLIAGEKDLQKFISRIEKGADEANLPYELLAASKLDASDAGSLNTLSVLKDWLGEAFIQKGGIAFPTDYSQLKAIKDSLGAEYLCLTGTFFLIEKKTNRFYSENLSLGVAIPLFSWPFVFNNLFTKNQQAAHFLMLIDMKTGKTVSTDFSLIKNKDRRDLSLGTLYSFMLNVKKHQFEK